MRRLAAILATLALVGVALPAEQVRAGTAGPAIQFGMPALDLTGPAPQQVAQLDAETGHLLICYSVSGTQPLRASVGRPMAGAPLSDLDIVILAPDGQQTVWEDHTSTPVPAAACKHVTIPPGGYTMRGSAPSGDAWSLVVVEEP